MDNLTPKYVINDYDSDTGEVTPRQTTAIEVADMLDKSVKKMEEVIRANLDAIEKYTTNIKSPYDAYVMVNMSSHNIEGNVTRPNNVYSGRGGSSRSALKKVNFDGYQFQGGIGDLSHEHIVSFTEDLTYVMEYHANVSRQLRTPKGVPSLKTDRLFLELTDDNLLVARVNVLYDCPNCLKETKAVSITRHMTSQQCLVDTASKDVRMAGYQSLLATKHTSSVVKAAVGAEARPKEFEYWVPQWVNEAIEQFEKRGGFAGLSLSEYLSKLAAERQTPN